MNKKIDTMPVRQLFEAVLTLETVEECYLFFEDLLTVKEIESLSQRLQVAELLRKKETYVNIARIANSSTATVSRVNRVLSYGNDGFEMVFSRMEKNASKNKRKK
ncbi:MAG: TrpR YerC/YecD [Lachnospiraceae bacterium]|nr:TrpR YerC/YecD [Lachnospiraceae bacterium]